LTNHFPFYVPLDIPDFHHRFLFVDESQCFIFSVEFKTAYTSSVFVLLSVQAKTYFPSGDTVRNEGFKIPV
jgi:hypothetical protein